MPCQVSSQLYRLPPPGAPAQRYTARFTATVTAPWTNGQALDVSTTGGFEAMFDDLHYQVGTLVARAQDGSVLTLEAANGDPDTFQLTVDTQGTTSAFTMPWSDETRLPFATIP